MHEGLVELDQVAAVRLSEPQFIEYLARKIELEGTGRTVMEVRAGLQQFILDRYEGQRGKAA